MQKKMRAVKLSFIIISLSKFGNIGVGVNLMTHNKLVKPYKATHKAKVNQNYSHDLSIDFFHLIGPIKEHGVPLPKVHMYMC